jgi:regulation of enolase protein 1 (concanavalin A-like superfamily)
MSVSDDFATGTLGDQWTVAGPAGTSAGPGASATDGYLELVTPDGDHNVWGGANNGVRALQATADTDFTLEAGFLTTPTERYQMHGFLVEQDAANWLRFDIHSDGSQLYAFAAVIENDTGAGQFAVAIPDTTAYLRVTREGDLWTLQHSADGAAWATAGSFTHAMTAASAGVFAGNVGDATGYTARVDYFEVGSDPIADEDGGLVPPPMPPEAADDVLVSDGGPQIITAAELLANDTDPNGDPLTITAVTQPAGGSLVDNGDGSWTYTPDAGSAGPDSFAYTVSDGTQTDTATVTLQRPATSDDFATGTLGDQWSVIGPGGSAALARAGGEAYLELTLPEGEFNLGSGFNTTQRAMQAVPDTDLGLEVGFLSTPSAGYQMQGLLVEQDADNWIRFDVYSSGSAFYVFGAVTQNGAMSIAFNQTVAPSGASHLRLERSGDTWVFERSGDGENWVTVDTLTHALTASAAGVFAGSTGGSTGYTAQVDYFYNTAAPLAQEDPPPVAGDDAVATGIDTALPLDIAADLLANDSDPRGAPLLFDGAGAPQFGTLADNGDGTLTYTPQAGFAGADSFDYTIATDLGTDTASVTVAVTDPASAPPAAGDDTVTTQEDEAVVIAVLGNDLDPDGDPLTVVGTTDPDHGSLVDNGDGTLTYTPDPEFSGTDAFTYTITDGRGYFDTAGVTIAVAAVNDAPEARGDALGMPADAARVIDVAAELLANDSDAEGDPIALAGFTQPQHGTLVDNGDGTLTYTPPAGFVGTDRFTYSASDGTTTSEPATAWIDVGLPGGLFSDDFNTDAVRAGWSLEGPAGTAGVTRAGIEASLEIAVPDGDYDAWQTNRATRLMQDAADEDFVVEAKFLSRPSEKYQIQGILIEQDADNWLRFDTVHDGQDLRVFAGITQGGSSAPAINDTVSPGAADYLRVERAGDLWTLSHSGDGETWQVAGSFTQSLAVTQAGLFAGSSDAAPGHTARVDYFFNSAAPVVPEDDIPIAPVVTDDVIVTGAATPVSIDVAGDLLANDTDANGDPLSFVGAGAPAHGTLADDGEGTLTYTPDAGFAGVDSFAYTIGDGTFEDSGTVWIGVDNGAPQAGADSAATDEDTAVVLDVLANDLDPDGDPLTIASVSAPAHGSVATNPDGTLTYTPDPDFNGADSFTYTLSDRVQSETAVVSLAVAAIPDAPVAADDTLSTNPDTALTIDLAADLFANDSDGDGDPLSLAGFAQPANGTLAESGDGTLLYTPDAGFQGTDSFTYTVGDGTGLADTATASVVVADPIQVWYGTEQTFGSPGEGQDWVNILGNVDTSQVTALSYTLNGGAARSLSIGPDTRRLEKEGDFNVDIAYSELDGSPADDVVRLQATLADGSVATKDVTISYTDGASWPADYAIDWETVDELQDAVQVVDGLWSFDSIGARPVETGYDRLLAIGDRTWDNYEATVNVTMNDIQAVDPIFGLSGAFGLGMLWNGHTDTPLSGWQPKTGYIPIAAFTFRNDELETHASNWVTKLDVSPFVLEQGTTYEMKFRVEQIDLIDRLYSIKIWESGTPEPDAWYVQAVEQFTDPMTGAFAPFVHYWDVTIGDLDIQEIPGNDILPGTSGDDVLSAFDDLSDPSGVGETDVLVGEGGSDLFVFGDESGAFYTKSGEQDFATAWDFDVNEDVVQLHGTAADYLVTTDHPGLPEGTAIWLRGGSGEADELIGVLKDVTGVSLDSGIFSYIDLLG